MSSFSEISSMAKKLRNSKHNLDACRVRYRSYADSAPSWWKDGNAAVFAEKKNIILGRAVSLVSELNTLEQRLIALAVAVKKADDERRKQ